MSKISKEFLKIKKKENVALLQGWLRPVLDI